MENLKLYKEFVIFNQYSDKESLNEGFLSKTFLALSLTFASLFVNIESTQAAHSPVYPTEFKIMKEDYGAIMGNLRGLSEHIKDPAINSLLDDMVKIHRDIDDAGGNFFNVRWNAVKPKIVDLIKKYGTTNYNIEQICKHITAKDFPRASVDARYIKDAMDKIATKYKVTGWEKTSASDVAIYIVLGIVGLIIASLAGFGIYVFTEDAIRNYRYRRNERRRRRQQALNNPPHIHPHPAPQPHNPPLFNIGARLTYINPESPHNGKNGTLIAIRGDGKYSIRFEDGTRFAASPQRLRAANIVNDKYKKLDPYGEEKWEE